MSGLNPSKAQRLLDLLAFLASHRFPVHIDQILERVPGYARHSDRASPESIRRKFERDKSELRAMGIQIETVGDGVGTGRADEGYRLRSRDFYLPVLKLLRDDETAGEGRQSRELRIRPDELRVALEGLAHAEGLPAFPFRTAARSAMRKLTFDLAGPEGAGPLSLDDPAPPILHLARGPDKVVQERLALLADALLRRKRVRFRYYAIGRDQQTGRHVEPHGLIYQGSRWYLVAHDLDRDGRRVFRVDRIDRVDACRERPEDPDFELPGTRPLQAVREREAWELGDTGAPSERVTVCFDPPLHRLAHRNRWGEPAPRSGAPEGPTFTDRPPADSLQHPDPMSPPRRRVFRVARPEPLLRWVLSLGPDARVVDPASAIDDWQELAERVRAAHLTPARSGSDGEASGQA